MEQKSTDLWCGTKRIFCYKTKLRNLTFSSNLNICESHPCLFISVMTMIPQIVEVSRYFILTTCACYVFKTEIYRINREHYIYIFATRLKNQQLFVELVLPTSNITLPIYYRLFNVLVKWNRYMTGQIDTLFTSLPLWFWNIIQR